MHGTTITTTAVIAATKATAMTTLQKTVIAAAFAVAVGAGIYEAQQAANARAEVQRLQQQEASLDEQVQQLKLADKERRRQLADLSDKVKREVITPKAMASTAPPATMPYETLETEMIRAFSESTAGRREVALKKIGQSIALANIPRALAFLATRPGTNGVESPLFPDLASKWGNSDPSAASVWADALTDPDTRKAALEGVLKGWTNKSPEAAATYAATLSPQDVQEACVLKVIGEWTFWGGADGAANWVAQFPAGQLRDKALGAVVFWGVGQCPATIADMLDATQDPAVVKQYGEQVANVWLSRDKPAARSWIEKSPLPDDAKQRLLNR